MPKKVVCMYCDHEEEYIIKEEPQHICINGVDFDTTFKYAYCKKCGGDVYPSNLGRYNDLQMFDGYKKRVGLLTSDQIKDIRKKRGMSQVELARFLRLGEKTIARYETGTIQEKSLDLLLRLVDNNESYKIIKKFNQKK